MHVLDAAAHLDQQPRAAHYGTPAIPEFIRAGIVEQIRERGLVLDTMCWRQPADAGADGEGEAHAYIAGFDAGAVLRDVGGHDLRTHCLVLQDLDQLMLDEAVRLGAVVEWEHKVVGVGQDERAAWAEVELKDGGRKRVEGDYVVGCDGANSAVRRALFGDEFPGWTWDAQIIATNVGSVGVHWVRWGLKMTGEANGMGRRTMTLRASLGGTTPTLSSTQSTSSYGVPLSCSARYASGD